EIMKRIDFHFAKNKAPPHAGASTYTTRPNGSPPEIVELAAIKRGIFHRAVYAFVPEIVLQPPRIVARLGQRKAARVPQHMRMHAIAKARGLARARDQLVYSVAGKSGAALG